MKKLIYILLITFVVSGNSFAQLNLAKYHLRNTTVVGQELNASFTPDYKFYISLPVINNLNFDFNMPFAYNDLFEVTGDSVRLNIDGYLQTDDRDFFDMNFSTTVLGFGFQINEISNASFFINSRNSASFGFPKDIARWAWNGNGQYIGQQYEVDDLALKAKSYVEFGMGYARDISIAGLDFRAGTRVKYIAGLGLADLDNNATINILTNSSSYQTTFAFENATLRTAGIDLDDEDGVDEGISEGDIAGSGFGIDIGAEYFFNDRWSFNFAANDLGWITWKNAAKEITLIDNTFVLEGVDITEDNFDENLTDQFEDIYEADTVDAQFTTSLNSSIYMGASYRVTNGGTASATLANSFTLGELRTAIGIGYTHEVGRVLAASVTLSKTPQQPVDFGAGFKVNGGPFQLHFIADGLIKTINIPEAQRVNFNFGINFTFGNPGKSKKLKIDEVDDDQLDIPSDGK